MVNTPRAVLVLALAFTLGAGCQDGPATPSVEALPATGFSPATEALLFGSSTRCRAAQDCESGACLFGSCAGLITVDEPWLAAVVGQRLRDHLSGRPGVADRLVSVLATMLADDETGLAFRGRAARALGEVDSPAAIDALRSHLPEARGALGEVIALILAERGDPAGAEILIELTIDESAARATEALHALGGFASLPTARPEQVALRESVFIALLSALSADIELELNRAAIRSLRRFGDARAVLPLRRFLVTGPESLADEVALALRTLVNPSGDPAHEAASLGPDPRRWDSFLERNPPAAPPAYTPRTHRSEDDLDLPTP